MGYRVMIGELTVNVLLLGFLLPVFAGIWFVLNVFMTVFVVKDAPQMFILPVLSWVLNLYIMFICLQGLT